MLYRIFSAFKKIGWYLPGFILWAAFPPMAEKADVLFALAPLMWLSRQGDAKVAAKRWFQSGIFFWVATLSWMPAIAKNGGPWPLVVLGWFALAAYCTIFFTAYGYLSAVYWRWTRWTTRVPKFVKRLLGILLVEPILWCGFELLRSRLFGGFAWNQLGVVAVNGGFGSPAAWGGVYFCSAVIVLINGSIAGIIERVIASIHRERLDRLRVLETLVAFAAVWGIYSLPSPSSTSPAEEREYLKVALIQRNFPCCFQGPEDNPYEVYGKLIGNLAPLNPDLVVLPESAMCEFGPVDQQGAIRFAEWLSKECGGAKVLAGGTRFADGATFNSAALYDCNVSPVTIACYDKVHLVPFGEFIPGDKLIPWLQRLAPVGSCTAGEAKLLGYLGTAICFEDTDSALVRKFAEQGARALVFITNDSWFSHSPEALAHAWQATARAIETGLPIIRVGNSGVTGTISAVGRPSWLEDAQGRPIVDRRVVMFDRILLASQSAAPTPYVRWGDIPLTILFGLVLLLLSTRFQTYRSHTL